jgi:hypothetical protein
VEVRIERLVVNDRRCYKHLTKFEIPVALGAFIVPKEVLVVRDRRFAMSLRLLLGAQ